MEVIQWEICEILPETADDVFALVLAGGLEVRLPQTCVRKVFDVVLLRSDLEICGYAFCSLAGEPCVNAQFITNLSSRRSPSLRTPRAVFNSRRQICNSRSELSTVASFSRANSRTRWQGGPPRSRSAKIAASSRTENPIARAPRIMRSRLSAPEETAGIQRRSVVQREASGDVRSDRAYPC
jgi:hypothetical protein